MSATQRKTREEVIIHCGSNNSSSNSIYYSNAILPQLNKIYQS